MSNKPNRPKSSVHRLVLASPRTRTQSDRTVLVLNSGSGLYHSDLVGALPGAGISIGNVNRRLPGYPGFDRPDGRGRGNVVA
jgi:hypothetical protein